MGFIKSISNKISKYRYTPLHSFVICLTWAMLLVIVSLLSNWLWTSGVNDGVTILNHIDNIVGNTFSNGK